MRSDASGICRGLVVSRPSAHDVDIRICLAENRSNQFTNLLITLNNNSNPGIVHSHP